MNTKQDYIAVFDSGVGGISVLRHLRRVMPGERYNYFGESANAPYLSLINICRCRRRGQCRLRAMPN